MAGRILSVLRRTAVGLSFCKPRCYARTLSSQSPESSAPEVTPTPELFYTTYSVDGVEVERAGTVKMRHLFQKRPELCFENHDKGSSFFSDFSVDIFQKILAIQHKQSLLKRYFKFNALDILIRFEGKLVLDVAIPVKQITEDKSIYKDRVIGPLTVLLHNEVCLLKSAFGGNDNAEVLDLMEKALQNPWWNSLTDILNHPLFWYLDKKMASITLIKIWMTTDVTNYPHGLLNVPARKRSVSKSTFATEYGSNVFYDIVYTVSDKDGEYEVTCVQIRWDWRLYFWGQRGNPAAFDSSFYLGSSFFRATSYYCECLYTIRNIIVHWGSKSYDALAANYGLKTTKDAFILLDTQFRFSLCIFYKLKKLKLVLWEIT